MSHISQVVDYLFYLICGLVSLQISLGLLGARRGAGFMDFIETACAPPPPPFKGLIPSVAAGLPIYNVIRFRVGRLSVIPHGDQRIVEIIGEPKNSV